MRICIGGVSTHYSSQTRNIEELSKNANKTMDWSEKTGIQQVHIVEPGKLTTDEATVAAKKVLENAKFDPMKVDQLAFISEGISDYLYMDTSKTIIRNIGGRTDGTIYSYDICCGNNGTMSVIKMIGNQMISNPDISVSVINTALLWERHSDNRLLGATYLGDGAGAILLQSDLGCNEILSIAVESMSEYNLVAGFKYGGTKYDLPGDALRNGEFYYGILDEMHLKGILDHVVETSIRVGKDALKNANLTLNEIDYVGISGFHKEYNDAIVKEFEENTKVIDSLKTKGYLGTAGVMEVLDCFINDDTIEKGSTMLLIASGIDVNVEAMVIRK